VKEQQKRVLWSEFKNTLFSYMLGLDWIGQFVSTPELHSAEAIDAELLPLGQVWAVKRPISVIQIGVSIPES